MKWVFKLLASLVIMLSLAGCQTVSTKQVLINPGQTKEEVASIMGAPGNRQFMGSKEAWQYCSAGMFADDYVLIWFEDGHVIGMNTYGNDKEGSCSSFYKNINWKEAPDRAIEVRHRQNEAFN